MTGLPPKLIKIEKQLSPAERDALHYALQNPKDSAARITNVLNRHGHHIGYTTIKVARKAIKETA